MSKTFHNRREREARIEGKHHHEHGPDDVCPYCGKAKPKGKSKKKEYIAMQTILRMNPNEIAQLVREESDWNDAYGDDAE